MQINQISLIEPQPKEKSFWSMVKQPRLGIIILATILKQQGYDVRVFIENISPIDWDYVYNSDICGITCLTQTANEAYDISKKIREKNIPVIFGGPHATTITKETLQHCDYVIRGEGEKTLVELLNTLKTNSDLKNIKGISFKKEKEIINNPSSSLIEDLDSIPSPDLSLVHGWKEQKKPSGVLVTSRGCPYACDFCSVIKLFGRKWRTRSIEKVIEDIKALIKVKKPKTIFVVDDNFLANKERAKKLLNEMIKNDFRIRFSAQIRIDSATDEELIKLMKKAGFYYVYVGFESINQKTLDTYNKSLNMTQVEEGIKILRKYKINIHGMFVLGSDTDKPTVVEDTLNFCIKQDIGTIQFFPLTALPGTEFTKKMRKDNRVIDIPWNYYDAQHVNIFTKNIKPSVLQNEIIKAYKKFYSLKRSMRILLKNGFSHNSSFYFIFFGSFFIKPTLKCLRSYVRLLEKKEQGKYRGNTFIGND